MATVSPGPDPAGEVIRIPPERRPEAIRMLLSATGEVDSGRVRQFLRFAEQNKIVLDELWSRQDPEGRIRQTVLAVTNPGRTAMIFATPPAHRDETASIGALISHVSEAVLKQGTAVAQVLLDPSEVLLRQAFLCGGFEDLARLSYLERRIPGRRQRPSYAFPEQVTLASAAECDEAELLRALEASYIDTLDCPGLRGLRKTEDILRGHRTTGEYDPGLWWVMRQEGQPAGILLLNPAAAHRGIELVYLGLAPEARGRGLGRMLLRFGLAQLVRRDERMINLAVDERNEPAMRLYRGEGFRLGLRRRALIRAAENRSATATER